MLNFMYQRSASVVDMFYSGLTAGQPVLPNIERYYVASSLPTYLSDMFESRQLYDSDLEKDFLWNTYIFRDSISSSREDATQPQGRKYYYTYSPMFACVKEFDFFGYESFLSTTPTGTVVAQRRAILQAYPKYAFSLGWIDAETGQWTSDLYTEEELAILRSIRKSPQFRSCCNHCDYSYYLEVTTRINNADVGSYIMPLSSNLQRVLYPYFFKIGSITVTNSSGTTITVDDIITLYNVGGSGMLVDDTYLNTGYLLSAAPVCAWFENING